MGGTTFLLLLLSLGLCQGASLDISRQEPPTALEYKPFSYACPEGWILNEETTACYLISEETGTWQDGKDFCQKNGGFLGTVVSQTEQDFLAGVLQESVWIGLSDEETEGTFVWVSDQQDSTYTNWDSGEPNNFALFGEDCVEMRKESQYLWNDKSCREEKKFLCKQFPIVYDCASPTWTFSAKSMSCYQQTEESGSWEEGLNFCNEQGGVLATIDNEEDQALISGRLTESVWIGLSDRVQEAEYTWVSQTPYSFSSWYEGEPNNLNGEDCVEMRQPFSYQWNDEACTTQNSFLCQMQVRTAANPFVITGDTTTTLPPTQPETTPPIEVVTPLPAYFLECPDGWILDETSMACFIISEERGTWNEGKAFCGEKGASLASIESQAEQDFAAGMLSESVWIGLNDQEEEGQFVWENMAVFNYSSWNEGEPNNFNLLRGEDCVEMREEAGFLWNDKNCNDDKKFLCKQNAIVHDCANPSWALNEKSMKCIKESDETGSWEAGEEHCQNEGGHLATIRDEFEQEFAKGLISGSVWIGYNDKAEEGAFIWASGSNSTYTSWNEGEPNSFLFRDEDCVELRESFQYNWNDKRCSAENKFLCEIDARVTNPFQPSVTTSVPETAAPTTPGPITTTQPARANACPEGWTLHKESGFCYHVSLQELSWDHSEKYCEGLGGWLACVESKEEQDYVSSLLTKDTWIGLRKEGNKFVWRDGEEATYAAWSEGQPSTGGFFFRRNCVDMESGSEFHWSNRQCFEQKSALCKKPAELMPRTECPKGWLSDDEGLCIYISTWAAKHESFLKVCPLLATKAWPFVPKNEKQNEFLAGHLQNKVVWLGATDKAEEGIFHDTWDAPLTYTNWDMGQPTNSLLMEDCVEMSPNGKWNDQMCFRRREFVCFTTYAMM